MWILLFLLVQSCCGIIYDLNETEYDRLPPLFLLDEYPKCVRNNDTYCLVKLELSADPGNELMTIIKEYSNYSSKRYNYSTIDRGVCFKRHCRNFVRNHSTTENREDSERILEACLNESFFSEYGLLAKVIETNCDRHDYEKITDSYQIICTVFFMAILLMNIVGSLYDVLFKKNSGEKNSYAGDPYLLSFSISRNWKSLTTPLAKSSRVYQLRGLNGVRFVSTVLVIMAHTLITIISYIDNPHDVEKYYDDALMIRILVSGSSVVQFYFIMSGFLQGYLHLVEEEKKGAAANNNLTRKIWLRWMRLSPSYAVCLAFICTQLVDLGSGPLWSNLRESVVKDCRQYWWLHLLYLNSYVPDDRHCMVQTWHVATDTLLFIVGIVVLVKVPKRWRLRAVLAMVVAGMVLPAAVVWRNNLHARVMMNPEIHRTFGMESTYDLLYKPAHTNLLCFSAGLLASILCHRLEKIKYNIHQHKFLTPFLALLIPGIFVLFMSGLRYYDLHTPAPLLERALYTPILHAVVGFLFVVALVAGALGYKSGVATFMEWDIWSVMAKLSYGMYLVHFDLIRIMVARRTALGHASYVMFATNLVVVYGVSCLISLLLHLTVEAPFDNVVKTYYKRKDQVEKTKEA